MNLTDENTTELLKEWTKTVLLDGKSLAEDNDPKTLSEDNDSKTSNDTSGESQSVVVEA